MLSPLVTPDVLLRESQDAIHRLALEAEAQGLRRADHCILILETDDPGDPVKVHMVALAGLRRILDEKFKHREHLLALLDEPLQGENARVVISAGDRLLITQVAPSCAAPPPGTTVH